MSLSLEYQLLKYYLTQIEERKITFTTLAPSLSCDIHDKLLDMIIGNAKTHFRDFIHNDLRAELLVITAKEVIIYEDMCRRWNPVDMAYTRAYVRDIYITLPHMRIMYALVHMDDVADNAEDDAVALDEDDIIMMSDNYTDLVNIIPEDSSIHTKIIQISMNVYQPIKEYVHPNWKSIYKFAEKRYPLYDGYDSPEEEPYNDIYSDF
jgi:hypothetical protein